MGVVSGPDQLTCVSCKTWRMSRETQHKLVQQEEVNDLKATTKEQSGMHGQSSRIFQPTSASADNHKEGTTMQMDNS